MLFLVIWDSLGLEEGAGGWLMLWGMSHAHVHTHTEHDNFNCKCLPQWGIPMMQSHVCMHCGIPTHTYPQIRGVKSLKNK